MKPLCKICNGEAVRWGMIDKNKTCEIERDNGSLALSGIEIEYVKCKYCGFVFTTYFDTWSKQDFLDHIYNDDYIKVDPEYVGVRSARDVIYIERAINQNKALRMLDYGAGNKTLENIMLSKGYNVSSYDPMWAEVDPSMKGKKFNFITAFEVLEHTPTPKETVKEIVSYLDSGGVILFSTKANDYYNDPSFWYIAPRNGHVCMYSMRSLEILFALVGMKLQHDGDSVHFAFFQ